MIQLHPLSPPPLALISILLFPITASSDLPCPAGQPEWLWQNLKPSRVRHHPAWPLLVCISLQQHSAGAALALERLRCYHSWSTKKGGIVEHRLLEDRAEPPWNSAHLGTGALGRGMKRLHTELGSAPFSSFFCCCLTVTSGMGPRVRKKTLPSQTLQYRDRCSPRSLLMA